MEITKPKERPKIVRSLNTISHNVSFPNIDAVMDCQRYGSMTKLLRVTALVKRFIETARGRRPVIVEVTAQELRAAEKLWINTIQANNFEEERQHLLGVNSKMVPLVKQFGLFLDEEGTIRCRGRIDESSLSLSAKQPVLLPTKHYVTELIIRKSHELVHHNGIKETLNNTRGRYWILRGREAVKREVRNCVVCKKFAKLWK